VDLTAAQLDRARDVLLATAAGDALGAGYEFGPPLPPGTPVTMKGGGAFNWAPGEWTDDTSMALAIAEAAASGADLRTTAAQDAVTARWAAWARRPAGCSPPFPAAPPRRRWPRPARCTSAPGAPPATAR